MSSSVSVKIPTLNGNPKSTDWQLRSFIVFPLNANNWLYQPVQLILPLSLNCISHLYYYCISHLHYYYYYYYYCSLSLSVCPSYCHNYVTWMEVYKRYKWKLAHNGKHRNHGGVRVTLCNTKATAIQHPYTPWNITFNARWMSLMSIWGLCQVLG